MMAAIERKSPQLGTGVYTYAEAARLLRVSTAQVRGWAEGYVRRVGDGVKLGESVLQRPSVETGLLTFYDVIELRFVKAFRDAGVALKEIVAAARLLAQEWETAYPFARRDLYTDGRQLLRRAGPQYENVANKQQVFEFIEAFFRDTDFEDQMPQRWWPLGHEKLIVIDPHRSFGIPIHVKSGIRTDVLYSAYQAEQDTKAVADWYETDPEAVEAAVEFETRWLKAA